jgi:cyclophilin family peptidyl-prolyl cis-trans isomerase
MLRASPILLAAAAAALLAACGGGDDDNDPTVNSMAATPAAYGRTAVWTIAGLNLDKGVSFVITEGQCGPVAELGEAAANQRQFTCRVSSLGELIGQVNDAGGSRLATLRVIIPTPVVQLTLSQGRIELELDPATAPVTVNNFLNYVNTNFYNNTLFHRVIQDFVIQGGGFSPGNPDPVAKTPTQAPIALESNRGLSNVRGSLAMARTASPDSATSQYYINVVDNPQLDYQSDQEPGYAVFGRVTAGMDVVDAISVVPTRSVPSLGLTDVPVTNVVVTTARQVR